MQLPDHHSLVGLQWLVSFRLDRIKCCPTCPQLLGRPEGEKDRVPHFATALGRCYSRTNREKQAREKEGGKVVK